MNQWAQVIDSILKDATEKVLKASIALPCENQTAIYVLESLNGLGREVRVIEGHHRIERRQQIC